MQISLSETGKRFNQEWIFRRFSYKFIQGTSYAITGPNGSGKSTLLQVIAGAITASEGSIIYNINEKKIEPDDVFRYLSIAAPYEELIEEMTLREFLTFHKKFKPLSPGTDVSQVISLINLKDAAEKQIRYFSSGMKQRVKLAQAFFSDTLLLMLDEPCTNLDDDGIILYNRLISEYTAGRIVIISSNDSREYEFCRERIQMNSIK